MILRALPAVLFVGLACAGCVGFSAMQSSVTQLDTAAHTVESAQDAFLEAYRTTECRNANLDRVFASVDRHSPDLRLSVPCDYVAVSDADLKIRSMLLTAIALYADKLQELASGTDSGKLSTNSESVAKSINGFGKNSGLSQLQISAGTDTTVAKGVETAVIALTDFVLEHKKYQTIQDAAHSQQPHLEIAVERLKDENTVIGQALQNNLNGISGTIKLALAKERQEKSSSLFFDIVTAQDLVAGYDVLLSGALSVQQNDRASVAASAGQGTASGASSKAGSAPTPACEPPTSTAPHAAAPTGKPPSKVYLDSQPAPATSTAAKVAAAKPVNDLLDSIVAANSALAESQPIGLNEATQWIETCGKSASAVYNSLK